MERPSALPLLVPSLMLLLVSSLEAYSQMVPSLDSLAQLQNNSGDYEDWDMSDFDFDIASRRIPRQVKTILTKEIKPHIQELSIKTTILSRYASTAVYCSMLNRHPTATNAVFQFDVPANAFVSNFTMIIGGRVYQSEVKPKKKKVNKEEGGQGRNTVSEGTSVEVEVFRVEVSIPGRNRAVFLLTYEELLQRRLGRYCHVTSLRPLQLVSRLNLEVNILDQLAISGLEVLPLQNARSSLAPSKSPAKPPITTKVNQEENACRISFSPNIMQQAQISTSGVLGDFVVCYDVRREMGIGDIQVLNGHFVHYFAPKDLPVVPKNVVFVIDTSASMVGTKIKQTKEALFTILRDLRPEDHFNFVSFSNRIKVWHPNRLVQATVNNISDAKRFILRLTTNGGTNIDDAIKTGSTLVRDYLSGPDANPNSVSLIIFLTDGQPTVGEKQPTVILKNTRSAVQEKFCIFTIGMGNEVDYRLLERMALENCGMMRRISKEANASAMLKGFYDEIGTPLLSDIQIKYTEDAVRNVSQHLFTNYFNGSEIVVAGQLTEQAADSLHIMVTASNNDKSLVLESDVPLKRRQLETQEHMKAAKVSAASGPATSGLVVGQLLSDTLNSITKDFVQRIWGFLSIKDGIRGHLQSLTRREREGHVQRSTDLSLNYHFLTPLTRIEVEKPIVLADGSMAMPSMSGTEEEEEEEDAEQEIPSVQKAALRNTKGKDDKRAAKKSITISKTSADGDPHFVVEFPISKLTVCFNINGEAGHILRLVSDHTHSGVTVNGKLIGAPAPVGAHKQQRTYFSSIIIVVDRPSRAYIEVTPKRVILDSQDNRLVLPCYATTAVDSGKLAVAVVANANVTVTIGDSVVFVILFHHYKNPAPYQRDHLGFYIANSKGLSKHCHGLIGQFLYEDVRLVVTPADAIDVWVSSINQVPSDVSSAFTDISTASTAVLKLKGRSVAVARKSRRIYGGLQSVDCWFARNNAAKLIDGHYNDYLAAHMFDTGMGGAPGSSLPNLPTL